MIFNDLQLQAKRNGELEYAMDQAQTDMVSMPGPSGDSYLGFCAGLAYRWCWLRYGDADYNYDPQTREMDTPGWQATREQMACPPSAASRLPTKSQRHHVDHPADLLQRPQHAERAEVSMWYSLAIG